MNGTEGYQEYTMGKGQFLQEVGLGKLDTHRHKNETDPYLKLCTKINSKCIKDLNVRPGIIKLLEENIRENFYNIGLGNDFLDVTPKAQSTKAKLDKWEYIKPKSSINRVKRQTKEWEEYL